MITRITKENRAKYVQFFAKAAKALKNSGLSQYQDEFVYDTNVSESNYVPGVYFVLNDANEYVISEDEFNPETAYYVKKDFSITTLEEYFQNIEQLSELNPSFIRLPLDEEVFEIDLNTRQINIPASFKKSGLGVQGDHVAETVYFKVDRYFDITDLATTFIIIQWEAPNGVKMASPACFTDVSSENGKLIFGWGITKTMTEKQGTLKFSVAFLEGEQIIESLTSKEEELNISDLSYRLGTLTSSIGISQGLNIYANNKVIFENAIDALRSRIKNSPIIGKIEGAVKAMILGAEQKVTKYFDWKKPTVFADIRKDLVTIPDPDADGRVDNGLTLIATSPNGAGIVSYEFFKFMGEDEHGKAKGHSLAKGQGAMRYIKVDYPLEQRVDAPIYFIDETGTQESWRYFDDANDSWYDETDETQINPFLYERVAFCPIEGPGTYYVEVTNVEGRAVSTLNTYNDNTPHVVALVPAPTELDSVSITASPKDIFKEGEEVTLISDVVLQIADDETPYGEYKYTWCKRTYDENGNPIDTPIEGSTEANHAVTEIGDYVVHVYNWWNNADTSERTVVSNVVKVYLEADFPKIKSFVAANPTAIDRHNNADVTSVGDDLVITIYDINQEQASQYVKWMVSDNHQLDNDDISEGDWDWVYEFDEEGNKTTTPIVTLFDEETHSSTLKALEPGDYKAIVFNYITESNFKEKSTTDEMTADSEWTGRIIRVYTSKTNN